MADQDLLDKTQISVVALEDIYYVVDDPSGVPADYYVSGERLGGLLLAGHCQGRLTTESGVPVSTSDRTAQGTLYFTPYTGTRIAIFDGTRWKLYQFSERSLALTATSGSNYDVFIYDNSGTLTLELSAAWTNDTTRADALTTQNGVYVKSGATSRLWLGTIRASGSNVTADSGGLTGTTQVGAQRFVWNYYNRKRRPLLVVDKTNTWAGGTDTVWRQANAAAGNKVEYVCGLAGDEISAHALTLANVNDSAVAYVAIAIGVDSVTSPSGLRNRIAVNNTSVTDLLACQYAGQMALGYHYVAWMDYYDSGTPGSSTFYGDDGGTVIQSGLIVQAEG